MAPSLLRDGSLAVILASIVGHAMEQQQASHVTSHDRYPASFFFASIHAKNYSKVLSFGCSTGLEALTLASKYFPTGIIVGVDTDDEILQKARRNCRAFAHRVFFFNTVEHDIRVMGLYDVIFANSVLCKHPKYTKEAYPFERFESALFALHNALNTGGMLVVINPSYRVSDVRFLASYTIIPDRLVRQGSAHFIPAHTPNGTLVAQGQPHIFVKQ